MRYEVRVRPDNEGRDTMVKACRSRKAAIKAAKELNEPRVLVVEKLFKNSIVLGAITVEHGVPVRATSLVVPSEKHTVETLWRREA